MRSLRTAAVAGVSALALTVGTTAVAAAQDPDDLPASQAIQETEDTGAIDQGAHEVPVEDHNPPTPEVPEDVEPGLSSRINTDSSVDFEADQPANGPALFGSSKDLDSQPVWAQLLYGASLLGGVGSLIGLILGPIHNFLVHGPQA